MRQILPASRSIGIRSRNFRPRSGLIAAMALMTVLVRGVFGAGLLPTPLEEVNYRRLSTSAEISAYLERLAQAYPQARVETIGTSVMGRPLQALLLTSVSRADVSRPNRLTIEIVGSQHGTESAGAETLLFIARDLLAGTLRHVLDDVDVVLVPNANPDGRDLGTRANANRVNLNTDFVALTQPESEALVEALQRYRPEVVLDVHESAVLKRKTLALEGYMTNFTSQFEIGNNPNILPELQTFARDDVLAPWIDAVNEAGGHSHRYFGEIRSSRQAVTNGGLTLNNLRNRTAIEGTLSFLMETRLDPREGNYPTFRNIGARVALQRISIERFLRLLHGKRANALNAVAAARSQAAIAPLALDPRYIAKPGNPRASIELRRIADGGLENVEFPDHRRIAAGALLPMPAAYLIHENQAELAFLLERHGIDYRILDTAVTQWAVEYQAGPNGATAHAPLDKARERVVRARGQSGDLWIDLSQPRGLLTALLLEPRSTSSLWRTPEYSPLVAPSRALPVYRIPR